MSIAGHRNIKEVETYCVGANKKRLVNPAIIKLKGAT
jgi:hypothetical protein